MRNQNIKKNLYFIAVKVNSSRAVYCKIGAHIAKINNTQPQSIYKANVAKIYFYANAIKTVVGKKAADMIIKTLLVKKDKKQKK